MSPLSQRTQLVLWTVGDCWSLQKAAERVRGNVMDGGATNMRWLSVLPYTGGAQGMLQGIVRGTGSKPCMGLHVPLW